MLKRGFLFIFIPKLITFDLTYKLIIATIAKIKRLTFKRVTYYTLLIKNDKSEFEDFMSRMNQILEYKKQLGQILQFIKDIGETHGAKINHFRHERSAEALPPLYHYIETEEGTFGIRLYCLRLSDSIVILLNGDMKTHRDPEQCPNCKKHFQLANKVSKKIQEAIRDKVLWLNEGEIEMEDDFEIDL